MKRFITFLSALGFVLYMSSISAHAQGRGPAAPAIEHGKAADHAQSHDAKDGKQTGQEKVVRQDTTLESRIEKNPELMAKVTALLPMGMNLKTAADGFKNQGQFIAALHVSKNLNIPFADLKTKMTTGEHPLSLGQSIHELRPTVPEKEAQKEAEKAEKEAKADEKTTKPVS